MEKTYEPKKTEKNIYDFWEKGDYFKPKENKDGQEPFVITLPPPNVTGKLHLGHAMYVLEDIMVRYHRMLQETTLWLPGFDHASIAVEHLVTKQLKKEGKNKKDLGRKGFLKEAQKFALESKKEIKSQLKSMGFSLDWSKEAYTLDGKRSKAVKEAFKKLYEAGLIYQGERIINWCTKCQTAISDLENDHLEEEGSLYYIKYGPLTIATTRPETMFADVAVAINPQNKKYQKFIGQKIPLPLTNRQIPVIEDKAVDLKFGTGALKITPAHDNLDFEIGQRHNLENLIAIDFRGRLTEITGKYQGLKVNEAREKVVADLQKQGFIEKIEKHPHTIGHCQRCGTITEPLISKQWFVKTKPLAKEAIKAVKEGKIKIVPKRFEKIYFNWLENIYDWCISRQLWWGHKIPLEGEEDVLDTWFSSGLWPYSTLGWPEKTKDLKDFYPNTVRETAYDILFFWVAREIMMGLFLTKKVPYKTIYLHGLVRDKEGQKMGKSKGNVLNPLDLTERYGTDALRMALVIGNSPGNDISLDESKVKAYRNFANKVWNASRFILDKPKVNIKESDHPNDQNLTKETQKTIKKIDDFIKRYRFDLAADEVYHFFWHTFCDEYIEKSKDRFNQAHSALIKNLVDLLKLLHPFMPFLTETIWQIGKEKQANFFIEEALVSAPWPSQK